MLKLQIVYVLPIWKKIAEFDTNNKAWEEKGTVCAVVSDRGYEKKMRAKLKVNACMKNSQ